MNSTRKILIGVLLALTAVLGIITVIVAIRLNQEQAPEESSAAVGCEADCPGADLTDKPEGQYGCRDRANCGGAGGPGCYTDLDDIDPDYCFSSGPVCGNGQCESGENNGNCPGDCPCTAVNGGWSSWGTCSAQCTQSRSCNHPSPSCGGTSCSGASTQNCTGGDCVCGDGICGATENYQNCPADCGRCTGQCLGDNLGTLYQSGHVCYGVDYKCYVCNNGSWSIDASRCGGNCADSIDNDGDGGTDIDDPDCHTDGDPTNPDSYDPSRNESTLPETGIFDSSTNKIMFAGAMILLGLIMYKVDVLVLGKDAGRGIYSMSYNFKNKLESEAELKQKEKKLEARRKFEAKIFKNIDRKQGRH